MSNACFCSSNFISFFTLDYREDIVFLWEVGRLLFRPFDLAANSSRHEEGRERKRKRLSRNKIGPLSLMYIFDENRYRQIPPEILLAFIGKQQIATARRPSRARSTRARARQATARLSRLSSSASFLSFEFSTVFSTLSAGALISMICELRIFANCVRIFFLPDKSKLLLLAHFSFFFHRVASLRGFRIARWRRRIQPDRSRRSLLTPHTNRRRFLISVFGQSCRGRSHSIPRR